jgi:hypothetical protein
LSLKDAIAQSNLKKEDIFVYEFSSHQLLNIKKKLKLSLLNHHENPLFQVWARLWTTKRRNSFCNGEDGIRMGKKLILDYDAKIQEELSKENEVPLLNLESHNDIMYLFDHKTDSFMCQGNTIDDLIKNLGEYKKIDTAWIKYDEKIMLIKNGFLHV